MDNQTHIFKTYLLSTYAFLLYWFFLIPWLPLPIFSLYPICVTNHLNRYIVSRMSAFLCPHKLRHTFTSKFGPSKAQSQRHTEAQPVCPVCLQELLYLEPWQSRWSIAALHMMWHSSTLDSHGLWFDMSYHVIYRTAKFIVWDAL